MDEFNGRFQVPAAQRGTAFVACPRRDLNLIFSLQFERSVNRDNTVSFQNLILQIEPVKWRATLAGCTVTVHQHLDQTLSISYGPHRLGRFTAQGEPINETKPLARKAMEKTLRGKANKPAFSPSFEIPHNPRDSNFPTASTAAGSI
jgi:hypothetical protein